jgi:hypothetical protein
MSCKLLEEIRSADQTVEQAVRDIPDWQPEKHAYEY